jgi:hypothetical protein
LQGFKHKNKRIIVWFALSATIFGLELSKSLCLKEIYAVAIFTAKAQSHNVPPKRP